MEGLDLMSVVKQSNPPQHTTGEDISRLALLYQVAEQVNSTLELDQCLDRIVDGAYRIFRAEKVSLMLLDEAAGEMRICAARNIPDDVLEQVVVKLGDGLAGKVAESGDPLVVSNLEQDPRFKRKSKRQYRTGSFAIVPLKHKDRVLGVMNLTNRADGTSFTEEDLALLAALANQASIAIQNSRLIAQLNREKEQLKRGAFESNILYELSSSIRYGLGYQHLIELLSASLDKLFDYDVLCSLLIVNGDEEVEQRVLHDVPAGFIEAVRQRVLDDLEACPHGAVVSERLAALCEGAKPSQEQIAAQSSISLPLAVGGQAVGSICIASRSPGAFSAEDASLLSTIVERMAQTVERLQNTIRGEQDKMQSMVASMAEGVVMFDANDQLVVLNASARSMLGLARTEEFSKESFFKSILWNDIAEFLSQPVEDEPIVQEFDIDSQPEPCTLAVAVTPVTGDRRERLGRLAVMRDVTRERELDRMKSDFVAVVSHELRTPITSIKMFTTNLLEGVEGEVTEGQSETLSRMLKNLDRLSRLINDLLDLSKLEAGKMKMQVAPVDLSEAVQAIVEVFEPGAATKEVTLETTICESLPVVWADADRVMQVLTNLLGNALKFTPEGGRITVDVARRNPDPTETIGPTDRRSPLSGEGYIRVAVSDTGPGIPGDDIEQVFDKFYQTDHSMTRKTGGTGLGLPICREIITKHGGRIWAESTLGSGSTFSFELPVDGRKHDRAQLQVAMEREIRRARRYNAKFSILMLDIDDFTGLNEQYGYADGDAALLQFQDMVRDEVKKFLQQRIRETDIVGRFGGDEFLVIAPETDDAGARAFGERVRGLVEGHSFSVGDQVLTATVSIGVTAVEDEDLAPVSLLRRATAALAQAKDAGKNKVF